MTPDRTIEECLNELSNIAGADGINLSSEISALLRKFSETIDEEKAWSLVRRARASGRPRASAVIADAFEDFIEMHGDRTYADDGAIIGGVGLLGGKPVTVIASQKGSNLRDTVSRNGGMASPEGYRKALRLAQQAEKFGRPVITLVDTQGAFPGLGPEERGIGQAIAMNLREFSHLRTPIVCVVLGEGGSGGALGLSVCDRLLMLENSYFSVITPEAFASLVLRDPSKKKKAAAMMKVMPEALVKSGFCDGIIPESSYGEDLSTEEIIRGIRESLLKEIAALSRRGIDELLERRDARYFSF